MKRLLLLFCFTVQIFAQPFNYSESFESSNPFVYWTSNATYTINYFGLSSEHAVDGSRSLKMDITINGSGDKDCYYYWKLPLKVNLHGSLSFSTHLFMDATTAQYVKLGYHYGFPPTGLERTPTAVSVTQFNGWWNQYCSLSDDVLYHADYFSTNKIYNSTRDDFGRELQFIQLIIKGKGSHRLVFYIDKIEISGNTPDQNTFTAMYTTAWNNYKSKISLEVAQKQNEYASLEQLPDTIGKNITQQGKTYYSNLISAKSNMSNVLNTMNTALYFGPEIMDSMNTLLGLYPTWMNLLKNELSNPGSLLDVYTFPSTNYNRLDEINLPGGLQSFDRIHVRGCPGEYEPISLLLQAKQNVNNISFSWTNFTGASGTAQAGILNPFIAKVWYQAGITETDINNKLLTQELLIKNDSLIKVDRNTMTNYLLVTNSSNVKQYIDVSTPTASFPTGVTIKDSPTLRPFSIPGGRNKHIWLKFKMPDKAGIYTGQFSIYSGTNLIRTFEIEIEVLPFTLDASRLTYGIYYNGYLDNVTNRPFHFTNKTEAQLRLELADMLNHGVKYPTSYQILSNLNGDLQIRNEVGLPNDRLYAINCNISNPQTPAELEALKIKIAQWKTKLAAYNYQNLYAYGIDEATGSTLLSQRSAWLTVHEAGARVFVSCYLGMFEQMGDLLDLANNLGHLHPDEADKYHSVGHQIFSYSNPQGGYENPEIYRRNYGIALWKAGYDGAMDYAYQKNYGAMWNDFDGTKYRDQNFTYAATDQVISTIQWEGFAEAVDDVRYLSTLLNKIDLLKYSGQDASYFESFVSSIDPNQDLDNVRLQVINKIIEISALLTPDNSVVKLTNSQPIDKECVKITFDKVLSGSEALKLSNYSIANGISIYGISMSNDAKSIVLSTTPHSVNTQYTLQVNNIRDVTGNLICSENNKSTYLINSSLKLNCRVYLQGAFKDTSMQTTLNSKGVIPLKQPYNKSPWNYSGAETIGAIPTGVVDWILVELREAANPSKIVSRKAGLLLQNGYIVGTTSTAYLCFDSIPINNYYIALRHRNHLSIMSAVPIYLSDAINNYDFTNSQYKAFGNNSLIQLSTTKYGMAAGDGDSNGIINVMDYTEVANYVFQSGYINGDLDLSGTVSIIDYQKTFNCFFRTNVLP